MSLHNDDDLQRAQDACRETSPGCIHSILDAVLPAYTARVLREAADDLALWLHEVNLSDDVIAVVCTWVRARARADAMTPQQETDQ